MADEHTESSAHEGTNGQDVAPVVDRAKMTRAEQDAADRAAFLAGDMEEDEEPVKPAKPAPKKKPSADVDDDEDEVDNDDDLDEDDDDDDLDDDDDEDADDDDEEDEDEEPTKGTDDPELAKRLAQVRKRESRMRAQAADRDRAFEQQRKAFVDEWKPKIEKYEEFERLKTRKSDPVGMLKALGYTEDDFEHVAVSCYSASKAGAADPKYKAAAAQSQRERELRDGIAEANARAKALEERLANQDVQAQTNAQVEKYLGRVTKAIGDETPLAKKRLELDPKKTRRALSKIALTLSEKAGGNTLVDPKKVIRAFEKKCARDIELAKKLSGEAVDVPAAKKKPGAKITVVDKTRAAAPTEKKTNGANGATFLSREEMIERMRKIERGEIDPEVD
jgi:hypothetical protein